MVEEKNKKYLLLSLKGEKNPEKRPAFGEIANKSY